MIDYTNYLHYPVPVSISKLQSSNTKLNTTNVNLHAENTLLSDLLIGVVVVTVVIVAVNVYYSSIEENERLAKKEVISEKENSLK